MKRERLIARAVAGATLVVGLPLILLRQAWRESHRGGFPLWSMQTLAALIPLFIIAAVVLAAHVLYYAVQFFRAKR
jgi:hypothetical protein